ncbi:MAG: choice-of-anchor M domain-containing protein [Schaalia odontolytica]|nr:choice-of-anchor M domain-containing protein [Schaalia odontolytica]MDU5760932.1 choice-of-anchor M domain-containing protein [Schaalia odontolytica]
MKSFSALSAAGRGVARPPAFLPSRGRRPAREIATRELRSEWSISKPGQALPPPTGPSGRASQLEARPGPAAAPGASRRPSSASSRSARLGMSLCALLVSAFLIVVGAPSSFADPSPDPDLAQSVAAHEEWSNEASEINVGHVDLGPRLIDGQWRAGLRHDAETGAVWRDPNQTVLRVNDAAIMTAPDSADYPFLADVAGKPVYVVPQTQNPGVVWLGWNTQDPAVTATIDRGLTMRVGPVSGPGRAWLFLQSGTFGKPLLLADSGAAPGDVWIDSGTHVHANWAFSAPGTYTATVTFLGTTTTGEAVSASTTLRFAVGDAASASEALAMAAPAAADAASAGASASSSGAAPAASGAAPASSSSSASGVSSGGLPDWAFLAIIAVAAASLLVIGALVVARSRRSRAEQAAAIAEADSILALLPTARGEGSGERGPGLVDRGGEQ